MSISAGLIDKVELRPSTIVALYGPSFGGKTTLGRMLSERTNLVHRDIDEDGLVLAGILGDPSKNWFENSNRMAVKYAHLHRLAGDDLVAGRPVVLTATYSHATYEYALREGLADTYRRFAGLGETPLRIFELNAPVETLAQRIAARNGVDSASDVTTREHAMRLRQRFIYMEGPDIVKIDTSLTPKENIAQILKVLESFRKTE